MSRSSLEGREQQRSQANEAQPRRYRQAELARLMQLREENAHEKEKPTRAKPEARVGQDQPTSTV